MSRTASPTAAQMSKRVIALAAALPAALAGALDDGRLGGFVGGFVGRLAEGIRATARKSCQGIGQRSGRDSRREVGHRHRRRGIEGRVRGRAGFAWRRTVAAAPAAAPVVTESAPAATIATSTCPHRLPAPRMAQ